MIETFGLCLLFGAYSVAIVFFSWKIGRASKWEETINLPPGSLPILPTVDTPKPDSSNRNNHHPLMEG